MFLLFVTRPVGAGYNPIALSGHCVNFYLETNKEVDYKNWTVE
jgi:hypothetical protein